MKSIDEVKRYIIGRTGMKPIGFGWTPCGGGLRGVLDEARKDPVFYADSILRYEAQIAELILLYIELEKV